MKRKAIVPLVLGLAIGLLAVKFGVDAVRRAQATGQNQKMMKVVLAKADIGAFDEIRADMVELTETPETSLIAQGDRIGDLQGAIGRVAGKSIPRGSPVLQSMLAPEGTAPGLTGRIPTGFRACSIKVDEASSVAFQIRPGVWVDVIVVMDVETGRRGKKEVISEVILQRVQVAAIGYESTPEGEKSLTKVKPAKSATLLVKDADVPKLHLAGTRGKISLAMRGDEDTTQSEQGAIAYGSEIGGGEIEPEVKPQPAPASGDFLKQMQMLAMAQQQQPRVVPTEPTSVMVFRGTGGGQAATALEHITFAGPNSAKIVEVAQGAPSRAAATLRGAQPRLSQPSPAPIGAPVSAPVVPAIPQPVIEDDEEEMFDDE